jgi:hypothetical protein
VLDRYDVTAFPDRSVFGVVHALLTLGLVLAGCGFLAESFGLAVRSVEVSICAAGHSG